MTHALSSIVAALTAATMGTPADVIKTRIMNQPLDSNGKGKTRSNYYQGFGILKSGSSETQYYFISG